MHKKQKKLLSKREIHLMEDKENGGAPRLKEKVQLFRKLRNKYRDLAKRQKIATRGQADAAASSVQNDNSRTLKKAEVFADALAYYEDRLQKVQGPGEKEDSEAKLRHFRNSGVTPEAIHEKAAQGADSEMECDRLKQQREGEVA
jgi:hypothetical protein